MVDSAAALLKPRSRLIDRFCGYFMGLPFFVELTGSGLSLPQNHFEMIGVPLHSSMIALILLLPQYKFRKSTFFYAIFFLIYLIFCLMQDFSRALLAVQSIYFLIFYFVLESLDLSRLRLISLSAVQALLVFSVAHLASAALNASSLVGVLVGMNDFFGLTIYQSHLTYPSVLIFSLWMSSFHKAELGHYQLVLLVTVILLEFLLMRRAALAILFVYLLAYRTKATAVIVIPVILAGSVFLADLTNKVIGRLEFSRGNAWNDSGAILSDVSFLFFGNGINNFSHNYFMHTLTTHGLLYSVGLFLILAMVIIKFFNKVNYSLAPCAFIAGIILVDWQVNANLYQPYYAAMLAIALLICKNDYSRQAA
jgi:hypothetical protein